MFILIKYIQEYFKEELYYNSVNFHELSSIGRLKLVVKYDGL